MIGTFTRRQTVAALAVAATALTPLAARAEGVVKVGLILPMTGPFASTGRQIAAAANLYIQEKGASVAGKKGISPRPGMRKTKLLFPKGGSFDGKVQAMGFRFPTKELVVPMRLSSFNPGELRNVVYLLTEGPKKIRSIPEEYVVDPHCSCKPR